VALLTNQVIRRSGLNPTYGAATAGGDTFTGSNRTFLHVKVGSTATTITLPVPTGKGVDFVDIAIGTLTVGPVTSAERMIGPCMAEVFSDPVTGLVTVNYSQVTGVTVAVFDLYPA